MVGHRRGSRLTSSSKRDGLVTDPKGGIPGDVDRVLHALMRGAALGMKLEGTLGCLARLRRHGKIVVDVNRLDADRVADARDATVDSGLEGIAIKRDLAPCQGATQRAVHSARDRGHDVVERRGHWRSFLSAVILTERSLDTVDDGFRNFAEIGVAGTVAVLEAGAAKVIGNRTPWPAPPSRSPPPHG